MFKPIFLSVLLSLSAPLAASSDPITDVISDQVDAFADRDPERAYFHASPMIQGQFGSPESFAAMVERGYPSLWSNKTKLFTDRFEQGLRARQIVIVTGTNGARAAFVYDMIRLNEVWKINGVHPVPLPDVSV